MQQYRNDLVLKAPEWVVSQFDQYLKSDKRIAAIKILHEYGVVG